MKAEPALAKDMSQIPDSQPRASSNHGLSMPEYHLVPIRRIMASAPAAAPSSLRARGSKLGYAQHKHTPTVHASNYKSLPRPVVLSPDVLGEKA